ncbi:MAG: peptide-methionine (S)-S-oxide reductase MsrA [Proteobacteria bacterium]|nr:peptide-methionine (S)-S-oxide reductase MsrA [Pseudomonadota bacterium]
MRHLVLLVSLFLALPTVARAETAVFAGGCFWCVESDMDHIKGVTSTISGYAGGTEPNPTYRYHVGYVEAVRVEFDPKIVSYDELVARFLRSIDVTDGAGQFCDRGPSYTPAIFTTTPEQASSAAAAVAKATQTLGKKLFVPVEAYTTFTDAEDYHQNYYLGENRVLTRFGWIKQSEAYEYYREACGREQRVRQIWGDEAYTAGKGGAS